MNGTIDAKLIANSLKAVVTELRRIRKALEGLGIAANEALAAVNKRLREPVKDRTGYVMDEGAEEVGLEKISKSELARILGGK